MNVKQHIKQFLLSIGCMLLVINNANALEALATVSDNPVSVNQVFELTISVDGDVDTDSLDLSALRQHFQVGSPNVSSQSQWINGDFSQNVVWKVALAAKEVGTWTIPSLDLGKVKTNPIEVKVEKGTSSSSKRLDVDLQDQLEKDSLFVGESTRYQLAIFIGENMQQANLSPPTADGVDVVQVGEDQRKDVVRNGKRYVIISRTYELTPQKDGDILLKGSTLSGNVIKQGRRFGSSVSLPVERKTSDILLSVKPVPADFTGVWLPTPDLKISQRWQPETDKIKAGEPLTRFITLRIKNINQSRFPNIKLKYPDTVRVYDEKPVYSDQDGYTVMTLKQVIIPRREGNVTLPGLTVKWWDTVNEASRESNIAPINLTIQPGETQNTPVLPDSLGAKTNEIAPPITEKTITVTDAGFWPYLTALFAFLWLVTLIVAWRELVKRQPSTTSQASYESDLLTELTRTVQLGDPIQIQRAYRHWQSAYNEHPMMAEIKAEIDAMNMSLYSKNKSAGERTNDWSNKALMSMLARASKMKVSSKSAESLATLVPTVSK
ncbi:BatD family protein [Veronia pacifica]|uniref:BatD family protein n=1 Tax=Veronia pacifica TaxID=1080227 RepID=UPI003635F0A3